MKNRTAAAALLGIALGLSPATGLGWADENRPAEAIIKDLEAVKRPTLDRQKTTDRDYIQSYMQEVQKSSAERSKYIVELLKSHPENEKVAGLLLERWRDPYLMLNPPKELLEEADRAIETVKNEKVKPAALYLKAAATLRLHQDAPEKALPAIEEFLKVDSQDPRGPGILYGVARGTKDESLRTTIEDRLLKDFPKSSVTRSILGLRKQREAIGKPFTLEFTDAIKGSNVSIEGLKGKVVVIDFWATWCGPCIAEMPRMKDLYAKYHDKGVEFIGVSLDQPEEKGGLTSLKEYVAKNEIAWPQYYQGNYWQSEFSSGWGINSIPALFAVDKDGNLASVEARGKLDELIPELLAKGTAPTP